MRILAYLSGHQGFLTLRELFACRHIITVILSPIGDNQQIISFCQANSIPCIFRSSQSSIQLDPAHHELLISSAFPQRIANEEYKYLPHQGINIHGSILPGYRGKNSEVWALINDEHELGITVHKLSYEFDAGEILKIYRIPINDSLSNFEIYDKLFSLVPKIVYDLTYGNLLNCREAPIGPNIYWRRREPTDSHIDWRQSARKLFLFVRALGRPPIYAYAYLGLDKIYFKEVRVSDCFMQGQPGSVVYLDNKLYVISGDCLLLNILDYTGPHLVSGQILI